MNSAQLVALSRYSLAKIAMQRISRSATLIVLAMSALFITNGCSDAHSQARKLRRQQQSSEVTRLEQDHIADAWGHISRLAEVDESAAASQIMFHLNSWNELEGPQPQWAPPDQFIALLSKKHQELCQNINAKFFSAGDVDHFRTSYILQRIAKWTTVGDRVDVMLAPWLEEQKSKLDADSWRDLDRACRLFDWTVRNVRLEELLRKPDGPLPKMMPDGISYQGPGYRQTTFETVWHGSGDEWQRSRLFIQLCRQVGIDACVIGPLKQNSLWRACAVRIGKELYLFDPRLGLAIPGPNQVGIATLQQAKSDASIMRRMNVAGWFENYPVTKDDLAKCVAYIDVTPEFLSWRMAALQERLTGDYRMTLAVDLPALNKRFTECPGIEGSTLWSVPFDAILYREAYLAARREDLAIEQFYRMNWGMLTSGSQLARARWQHLEGRFTAEDDIAGALAGYRDSRMTDQVIDDIRTDVTLQATHGVRRTDGETPEQFEMKIRTVQQIFRMSKLASSYWLGLLLTDRHAYESATSWLDKRFLEAGGKGGAWEPSARYSLARAYECLGKIDDALKLYRTPGGSPDLEHGMRLRARLLERTQQSTESESATPATSTQETSPKENEDSATSPAPGAAPLQMNRHRPHPRIRLPKPPRRHPILRTSPKSAQRFCERAASMELQLRPTADH